MNETEASDTHILIIDTSVPRKLVDALMQYPLDIRYIRDMNKYMSDGEIMNYGYQNGYSTIISMDDDFKMYGNTIILKRTSSVNDILRRLGVSKSS